MDNAYLSVVNGHKLSGATFIQGSLIQMFGFVYIMPKNETTKPRSVVQSGEQQEFGVSSFTNGKLVAIDGRRTDLSLVWDRFADSINVLGKNYPRLPGSVVIVEYNEDKKRWDSWTMQVDPVSIKPEDVRKKIQEKREKDSKNKGTN